MVRACLSSAATLRVFRRASRQRRNHYLQRPGRVSSVCTEGQQPRQSAQPMDADEHSL